MSDTSEMTAGTQLAQAHAGRFRVVGYAELRAKATEVAAQILADIKPGAEQIVASPILLGGGLPARLVVDALLPYGVVSEVVPCRIRRYSGVGEAAEAEFTLELASESVRGRTVIGIDDLVDGGQTLEAFMAHALERGAKAVEAAVIFAKPSSTVTPKYAAERGVTEWLVLPGEEHDFMSEISETDAEVGALEAEDMRDYFTTLGLESETVESWQNLQKTAAEHKRGVQ